MGLFPNMRLWSLINTDTGDLFEGDFEAQGITRNVGANWATISSLSRPRPVQMYLNGEVESITFNGRIFDDPSPFNAATKLSPNAKINKLLEFIKPDPTLGRPPIVLFESGSELFQLSIIRSISNIVYDGHTWTGLIRGVSFSMTLERFESFRLESGPPPETRYARAKAGDYFELLAEREYHLPMLGDVIRKRANSVAITLAVGTVVKLPSLAAISKSIIEPKSVALAGINSRSDSPQKTLRQEHERRRNITRTSHIIPVGL